MPSQWEDAVNEEFVKRVGQYLADMDVAGEDDMADIFNRFMDDYESTIDNLPEPSPKEDDEDV